MSTLSASDFTPDLALEQAQHRPLARIDAHVEGGAQGGDRAARGGDHERAVGVLGDLEEGLALHDGQGAAGSPTA